MGFKPPPLFKASTLWPTFTLFVNLFPLNSFLFHPLLRHFRLFLPTLTQPHNLTHQPSLHIINWFKQISKGWFYQSNCCFLSKANFGLFKSLYKHIRLFYLWDIFRFIFRQLRMTFFHMIMVTVKNNFSSNA